MSEREMRIKAEQADFDHETLNTPMHDLEESLLYDLCKEAGCPSVKSYLNAVNGWSVTLGDTIEYLVNTIYTVDGVTYDTMNEVQSNL